MNIVIISNGPGLPEVVDEYGHSSSWIPALVKDRDITFSVKKVYDNDVLRLSDGDAWIITGSKYSVYDDFPWIYKLKKFIHKIVQKNKYVLGICFGHQIIAESCGGKVEKNKMGWELGSYPITLSDEGMKSDLFKNFKNNDIAYESHQDVVSKLPENFIELGYTDKGNQSFSFKNTVYGVQFHPEFSYDVTRRLMDLRIRKGVEVDNPNLDKSVNAHHIISNFIKIAKEGVCL